LRGKIGDAREFFAASGTLTVDAELSINLLELLDLVSASPRRFVQLQSGDNLELEQELRELLEALSTGRSRRTRQVGKGKREKAFSEDQVPIAKSALSVFSSLA
jgi:SNF2 family DNA or RNA helicase